MVSSTGNLICRSVLLVKTHEFGEEARRSFHRAIILVRDPFSSLLAEFNRRSGGHIGYASADKYRRNGGRHWKNFVYNMANDWERMNLGADVTKRFSSSLIQIS